MRSESDKLAMTPLTAKFGKKDYTIELLRTNAQREWRKKLVEVYASIIGNFSMDAKDLSMGVFQGGLVKALINCPEKVADLLFEYAPDLPKDTILEESTEEQIVSAFSEVMSVAFPFLDVLRLTTSILSTEVSNSPRPDSLN